MPELTISPEAEYDLLEIWFYIAQDSPINADRFLEKLKESANKFCEFNEIGVDRPELMDGLKSFPVDHYLLYYRVINTGVELVRVMRSSRDVKAFF